MYSENFCFPFFRISPARPGAEFFQKRLGDQLLFPDLCIFYDPAISFSFPGLFILFIKNSRDIASSFVSYVSI